jgi:hypothetical protein
VGVLLVASLVTVGLELRHQDWSVLGTAVHGRRPGFFLALAGLALLANGAALLAAMMAFWALLSGSGERVSPAVAARIYWAGTFTKYMPGKVFSYVVSVHMGKTVGIPAGRMLGAWLSTLVIGLVTGATVGLLAAPDVLGGSAGWLLLAAVPTVAALVWPQLVGRAAAVVARLRRRPAPEQGVAGRAVRTSVLAQLLSWLAGGLQLWLVAVALGTPPLRSLLLCVGAFSLATVVGMFAVFTPEGLGVREVVLLAALGGAVALPVAGVVALLSRLVVVVSEVVTAGAGLLVTSVVLRRRSAPSSALSPATVGERPRIDQGPVGEAPLGSSESQSQGGRMLEQPLVSVVIPNYNYARTLAACIEAAQRQTYPSIEIIVADDASTDDSVAVARRLGATVLETAVNAGVSMARNRGAAHARGDILFFVDSDVALEPDAVANAVSILKAEPGLGAVCGMYLAEPMFPDTLVKRYRAIQQYVWFNEIDGPIPGLHSALFAIRTDVFREIGPFNNRLRWTEEQDYGFRLNARYEVRAVSAIRGRHDHDGTLKVMITKVFQRTRLGAPNWVRLKTLPGGAATGYRALGSGFVLSAIVVALSALLLGPYALIVAGVLTGIGIALDGRTYAYAFRHHGVLFGLQFTVLHLLVTLTSATAAGLGILQAVLFPGMTRRLYGAEKPA